MILLVLAALSQDAATLSFSERAPSAFPGRMKAARAIAVDLADLPPGAVVHRAVLRPGRDEPEAFSKRLATPRLLAGDTPLPLAAPGFAAFDATDAVRAALARPDRRVTFDVAELPGYLPAFARLDVSGSFKPKNRIPRATNLAVRHRAGQTFLAWTEVDPPVPDDAVSFRAWREKRAARTQGLREIRYRVWRADAPISAATIARAELVAEVAPLSGWNPAALGVSPPDDALVPRFVVEEGKEPVGPATAVYVHNPAAPGRAFYAVSVLVDGEEDLAGWTDGDRATEAVVEAVGPGEPVLQRIVRPRSFNYVDDPVLHYYVRWEAPPRSSRPSSPFDYLVATPPRRVEPAPVGLHLHCWGGNLDGGYGWWYAAAQGAVLLSTNQDPYDWWTGYHEHSGTWRGWSEGVVRDFTQQRVLAFLDWAAKRYGLDLSRVFAAGSSMGGSGSPSLGLRRADRVAWVVSWVGVHSPARSPQFRGSYERVFGQLDWKLPGPDGRTPAFEHFDDERFVRLDPAGDTPLICFSNGKNDDAIGWAQARDFWRALQETRRPHVFVWGQGGHGQRALLPGPNPNEREIGVDVRLGRTLPAFTRCSLDGNPGGGDPKDGDPEGQSNLWLHWDDDAVDQPGRWELTLRLARRAPADEAAVDVTPRRCRAFRPAPGTKVSWKSGAQAGEIAADAHGLVTAPQVKVSKSGTRLILEAKP
jgi:hypothetical protein